MKYNIKGKDIHLREKNSSSTYYTGYKGLNHFKEVYTVLGQVDEPTKKTNGSTGYNRFLIKFENGYLITALNSALYQGSVKNPYTKTMKDRGYHGEGLWQGKYMDIHGKMKDTKQYIIWAGIFRRCYDEKYHKRQPM